MALQSGPRPGQGLNLCTPKWAHHWMWAASPGGQNLGGGGCHLPGSEFAKGATAGGYSQGREQASRPWGLRGAFSPDNRPGSWEWSRTHTGSKSHELEKTRLRGRDTQSTQQASDFTERHKMSPSAQSSAELPDGTSNRH